jgi:hypothetical protein
LKPGLRPRGQRPGDFSGGTFGYTLFIALNVDLSINNHIGFAPFGKGIYHRDPHTVKPPGNLIGLFVEFTPRMKLGHDQLQGADPFGGMYVYRNTPAIILHPDYVFPFQYHEDRIAVTLHGLVHRIVHHFVYQMMKPVDACGPNIHTRPLAYGLNALEDLDIFCGIILTHGLS